MRRGGLILSRGPWPIVVALVLALVILALPAVAMAWDDCPKGVTELCTGACSRFIDTNGDGYCDHSQPEPTPSTTVTVAASAAESSTSTSTSASDEGSASGVSGTDVAAISLAATGLGSTTTVSSGPGGDSSAAGTTVAEPQGEAGDAAIALPTAAVSVPTVKYNVSPIAVVFFLIYAVSFVLYKSRRMRAATHRKIWNVLLLLTFLITGVLGLLLTIRLNYGWRFNLPFDMLFWHVETGIVMSLISIFHIGWHLKYYRSLLRRRSTACEDAREAARAAREICSQELTYSPIPARPIPAPAHSLPARVTVGEAATRARVRMVDGASGACAVSAPLRAPSVSLEGNAQRARR